MLKGQGNVMQNSVSDDEESQRRSLISRLVTSVLDLPYRIDIDKTLVAAQFSGTEIGQEVTDTRSTGKSSTKWNSQPWMFLCTCSFCSTVHMKEENMLHLRKSQDQMRKLCMEEKPLEEVLAIKNPSQAPFLQISS